MKYLNPKRMYHSFGKKYFLETLFFAVFLLFFYGPLMNTFMLAFAEQYQVPNVLPTKFGLQWWHYIFEQDNLIQSIVNSFLIAVLATLLSMLVCIPAAYALARYEFKGKSFFCSRFSCRMPSPRLACTQHSVFYFINLT